MFTKLAITAALATIAIAPASAVVLITVEAPGVTNTTIAGTYAVETFDQDTPAFQTSFTDPISGVSFTYNGIDVRAGDQYGGAGGTTYAGTYSGLNFFPYDASAGTYSLTPSGGPRTYFGAYFASADAGNQISFYNNNVLVLAYGLGDLLGTIDQPAYTTNGLINVFANFSFTGGDSFDKIVFTQTTGGGFESDNHTLVAAAVPEPATWAMLLAGFGLVGFAARRRRTIAA